MMDAASASARSGMGTSLGRLNMCSLVADSIPFRIRAPGRTHLGEQVRWGIGDRAYTRPRTETAMDVLAGHLRDTFGSEWAKDQQALPPGEWHSVMRWWHSFCGLQKQSAGANHRQGQIYPITPSGDAMEFMSIADDLCQLRMAGVLRPKMVDRLRHHQEFQGARYECAVAAMFLRGGFEIEWLTGPGKKCEFVATHSFTGERVAVEAKSRRRSGTLNQSGPSVDPATLRVDVKHLYDGARSKCPDDMPSVILIDVNLPWIPGTSSPGVVWQQGVRDLMEEYPEPTAESPAIEAGLVFTSFGWHFTGTGRARGMQEVSTFPEHCRKPLSQAGTLIGILQGIQTYSRLPSFGYRDVLSVGPGMLKLGEAADFAATRRPDQPPA